LLAQALQLVDFQLDAREVGGIVQNLLACRMSTIYACHQTAAHSAVTERLHARATYIEFGIVLLLHHQHQRVGAQFGLRIQLCSTSR
jgi:hypothetical protein